jgi:hypothetical protein
MKRQVEVTADVFHLIWSNWRQGDSDENSILRRLLSGLTGESAGTPLGKKEENIYSMRPIVSPARETDIGKIRWVDDVRQAFKEVGGEADLSTVYRLVEKQRRAAGRSTVRSLEATIRQTIEAHSSDSRNFKPGNPDYFRHISRGRWALH